MAEDEEGVGACITSYTLSLYLYACLTKHFLFLSACDINHTLCLSACVTRDTLSLSLCLLV
jgi:hypothetical protein